MINDDGALLMEIAEKDPLERPFSLEEQRAFELGFDRGLSGPVSKTYILDQLNRIDGPLRCIELAGIWAGGRYRVLGESEEVGA